MTDKQAMVFMIGVFVGVIICFLVGGFLKLTERPEPSFLPGDIILFKKGVTFRETKSIPITLTFESQDMQIIQTIDVVIRRDYKLIQACWEEQ